MARSTHLYGGKVELKTRARIRLELGVNGWWITQKSFLDSEKLLLLHSNLEAVHQIIYVGLLRIKRNRKEM